MEESRAEQHSHQLRRDHQFQNMTNVALRWFLLLRVLCCDQNFHETTRTLSWSRRWSCGSITNIFGSKIIGTSSDILSRRLNERYLATSPSPKSRRLGGTLQSSKSRKLLQIFAPLKVRSEKYEHYRDKSSRISCNILEIKIHERYFEYLPPIKVWRACWNISGSQSWGATSDLHASQSRERIINISATKLSRLSCDILEIRVWERCFKQSNHPKSRRFAETSRSFKVLQNFILLEVWKES